MEIKKCFTCGVEKPINEYYSNKAKSNGIYGSCIPCIKAKLIYPKSCNLKILYLPEFLAIERWLPIIIDGVEFPYQISDSGRVRIIKRDKIAKPSFDQRGYPQIVLSKNKKRVSRRIHILVAEAFIGNPENLREVNHEDGNKLFPHYSNLKYVTSLENVKHAIDNGLRIHFSCKTKKVA
jgi:hypothetical protein